MKSKDKILTYEQAKELKWFGDNCTGLRQEYYELLGSVTKFGEKIQRLSEQGLLIEDFLRRNPGEILEENRGWGNTDGAPETDNSRGQ